MKNQKILDFIKYLIFFSIIGVCLVSTVSPSLAKYLSHHSDYDQARVSDFQINITSLDATNEAINTVDFDTETNSKKFQFTVENTGETAIHLLTVSLTNDDELKKPDYEFLSETDFYLMPDESRVIELIIYSAEPSYFNDIEEELHIEIVAEQAD
ncbi:hypothetical protein GIX45_23460 [Erwinia sp. CPCC 100877]|nr:hypothetical protein [Erwinia sp. CPCC 100877]